MATQYSFGLDQYPQTVEEATNILSNHKFNQAYYDNKKKRLQGNSNNNNQQCQADCQQRHDEGNNTPLLFAQMENRCYCCSSPAHKSSKCPKKDSTPRLGWKINQTPKFQGVQQMQQQMRQAGSVHGSEQAPAPAPASSGASTTRESLANVHSWVGFAQVT